MEKVLNESVGRLAKEIRKSGLKPKIVSELDKQDIHSELPEIHLDGKKTPGDVGKYYDIVKKTYGHEASKELALSKKRPERELGYWEKEEFNANRAADAKTALRNKEIAKEYQWESELLKKKENKPLTKIKNKLIKNKDASYDISAQAPSSQVNKIAKAVRAMENKDKANSLGLTPKEWRTKMYEKKIRIHKGNKNKIKDLNESIRFLRSKILECE